MKVAAVSTTLPAYKSFIVLLLVLRLNTFLLPGLNSSWVGTIGFDNMLGSVFVAVRSRSNHA